MGALRRKCACLPPLLPFSHTQLPLSIRLPPSCWASPPLTWPSPSLCVVESILSSLLKNGALATGYSVPCSLFFPLSCVTPIFNNITVISQLEQNSNHNKAKPSSHSLLVTTPAISLRPFRQSVGRTVSINDFSVAKFSG